MKTRIKIKTLMNGRVEYYPQHKTFLFWKNVSRFDPWYERQAAVVCQTLAKAQQVIDELLESKRQRDGLATKKVTYVKYP